MNLNDHSQQPTVPIAYHTIVYSDAQICLFSECGLECPTDVDLYVKYKGVILVSNKNTLVGFRLICDFLRSSALDQVEHVDICF